MGLGSRDLGTAGGISTTSRSNGILLGFAVAVVAPVPPVRIWWCGRDIPRQGEEVRF